MSQYKPYPAYRDSGVEWIGKVPEHWTIRPVKYLYSARLGKMVQPQSKSDEDILVSYHRAQTVQWECIKHDQVESMWASPAEIDAYALQDGDLLICEGGDVCRAAIFNETDTNPIIFQNSIHRVRSLNGNPPEWLLRLMQIVRSSGWIDVLCSKNTIVHFTSDKLASLDCPHPPLDEQQKILTVLRKETDCIDTIITKKTRFIELLKEKRKALITHAVTKGLDPSVKMKPSEVEWIGDVPEHWKVGRLGDFCSSISTGPFGTALSSSEYVEDGIPVINPSHMNDGICVPDRRVAVSFETATRLQFWTLAEGDLIVARRGELGRAAIVTSNEVGWICGTGSMRLTPIFDKAVTAYLYSVLQSEYARAWLDRESVGSTMSNLNESLIGRLPVAIPSTVFEQINLLTRLSELEKRIDQLVKRTQRSIDLLKERRSAFITAAVTGQIDLRESA